MQEIVDLNERLQELVRELEEVQGKLEPRPPPAANVRCDRCGESVPRAAFRVHMEKMHLPSALLQIQAAEATPLHFAIAAACPAIDDAIRRGAAEEAIQAIANAGVGAAAKLGDPEDLQKVAGLLVGQTAWGRIEGAFRTLAAVLRFPGAPDWKKKKSTGKKGEQQEVAAPVPSGADALRALLQSWDAEEADDAQEEELLSRTDLGKVLLHLGPQKKMYALWIACALALLVCVYRGAEAVVLAAFRVVDGERLPSFASVVGELEAEDVQADGRKCKYRVRRLLRGLRQSFRRIQEAERPREVAALGGQQSSPARNRRRVASGAEQVFGSNVAITYEVGRVPLPCCAPEGEVPLLDPEDAERSRRLTGECMEAVVNGACKSKGFGEPLQPGPVRLQSGLDAAWTVLKAGQLRDGRFRLEVSEEVRAIMPFLSFWYHALLYGMQEDGWEVLRGITWYTVGELLQNVDGVLRGRGGTPGVWLWDYRVVETTRRSLSAEFLKVKLDRCAQRYKHFVQDGARWIGPGPAPEEIRGFVVSYIMPTGQIFQHVLPKAALS